jgi:hypothetical protein
MSDRLCDGVTEVGEHAPSGLGVGHLPRSLPSTQDEQYPCESQHRSSTLGPPESPHGEILFVDKETRCQRLNQGQSPQVQYQHARTF